MLPSRSESGPAEPTPFLVLGSQRSGTSVTQVILEGHPSIATPWDETEAGLFERGYRAYTFGKESYRERDQANRALFRALAGLHATPETEAVGVKVALNEFRSTLAVVNALREHHPDIRVIHVIREDLVAQFASLKRAQSTGTWHVRGSQAGGGAEAFKVTLPVGEFEDYAADSLRTRALLRALGEERPVLEVRFEQAFLESGFDSSALFRFLGVEDLPVTWATMNKVAPPVEDYVENAAELREALAGLREPSREEVQAAARRALVEDVESERRVRVVAHRTLRWLEVGPPETAEAVVASLHGRSVGGREELSLEESLAVAAALHGRPPRDGCDARLRALLLAASDPVAADAWVASLEEQGASRFLALANLVAEYGHGGASLVDALVSRAIELGVEGDDLERCLYLVELAWEALLDVPHAERRLANWQARVGHDPGFQVLQALVGWYAGRIDEARVQLRAIASGTGRPAVRAAEILAART